MRRLALDYQKTGASTSKTGVALLLLGIAVTIYMVLQFRSVESGLAAAEENAGHLEQQIKHGNDTPETTQPTLEQIKEAKQANEILVQLALPWGELFKALESSNNDKVALLAIQPNLAKRSVKINGEAKDFTSLLNYIAQLEKRKTLTDVVLLNHEINMQIPEKPVHFALTANWGLQP
ncbi:PilN domain-containing protein [Sulfuriferula thiophila]|uniref:PilN domain-containing protein n=1 Tax=Sulfuriferula thiophila TaxID=1781211 RepID=UPI000F60EECB|nr:PilN domain-containing protein [Sulfuriferula thiophila]